jgi:hypothetical protein
MLSFSVFEAKQRSKQDMDSYPSRCPGKLNRLLRTINQSTGIDPDANRRASAGRA